MVKSEDDLIQEIKNKISNILTQVEELKSETKYLEAYFDGVRAIMDLRHRNEAKDER